MNTLRFQVKFLGSYKKQSDGVDCKKEDFQVFLNTLLVQNFHRGNFVFSTITKNCFYIFKNLVAIVLKHDV